MAGVPGAALPAVVLESVPPVLDAAMHMKGWENRIRSEAETLRAAACVKEPLVRRLVRAIFDR